VPGTISEPDGMELIAEGTALAMERLFRSRGSRPYLGRLDNWTGHYDWSDTLVTHDPGFLLGRLFLLWRYTGDDAFLRWALSILEPMVEPLTTGALPNAMAGSEIYYGLCWAADATGEAAWRSAALAAADNLVRTSWDDDLQQFRIVRSRRSQAVDTAAFFFCLPWAAGARPDLASRWTSHHYAVLDAGLLRDDGSSFHVAELDASGRVVGYSTAQGFDASTTWSRGHAWMLHGLTAAFEHSADPRFEEAAVRAADWWLAQFNVDPLPPYDAADPAGAASPRDSCAAAITANAMTRLITCAPLRHARFQAFVDATVATLLERCLGAGGMLLHSSWGNRREQSSHDIAPRVLRFPQEDVVPDGNYFVVELLARRLRAGVPAFGLVEGAART
jgi:unsaturated chondroitin disaccharide hydrolase